MNIEFYEGFLFLRNCFYHVPIWNILEFLPLELPLNVLPLELTLIINEEVVQVV